MMYNVSMRAKKLLVNDKIKACVKQICLLQLGVICKVSNRKTMSRETFCFLKKRLLYQFFSFCASGNLLFS